MRKSIRSFLLLLVLSLFSLPAMAAEEVYNLSFTSVYPDRHDLVKLVYKPWIDKVKEMSGGRILITYYNPNTLCPDVDALDSCLRGQVSIVSALSSRNPGRLPLNSIQHSVAMRSGSALEGAKVYWELVNTFPEFKEELKGLKLLWVNTTAAQQMHAEKFAIKTLADLKGKKMISSNSEGTRMTKALGVSSIMMPNMDIYLSLSRGMADGVVYPIAALRSYKLNESTKHHTFTNLYTSPIYAAINQELFDSLPKDLQDILMASVEGMSEKCGECIDALDAKEVKSLKEEGHLFYEMDQAERNRWKTIVDKSNREFFISEMAARNKNIDAVKMLDAAIAIAEKHSREAQK